MGKEYYKIENIWETTESVEMIDYYDGPLFEIRKTKEGTLIGVIFADSTLGDYLKHQMFETLVQDRYIVFDITDLNYANFKNKNISYRALIQLNKTVKIWDQHYQYEGDQSFFVLLEIPIEELHPNYLPDERVFFTGD